MNDETKISETTVNETEALLNPTEETTAIEIQPVVLVDVARPFMTTPLEYYTVSEGLLALIFILALLLRKLPHASCNQSFELCREAVPCL